jgi:hypothetical protein
LAFNTKLLTSIASKYVISNIDSIIKDAAIDTDTLKVTFSISKSKYSVDLQDNHGDSLREICVQKYLTMLAQGYILFSYKDGWICKYSKDSTIYQLINNTCTCADHAFRGNKIGYIGCKHLLMLKGFNYLNKEAQEELLKFIQNN